MMKEVVGSPGTKTGLTLRLGQCGFAATSIALMVCAAGFSNYTAFCYLIASMGLQVLWSFGLACLDVYALRIKRDLQSPVLVSLFVVGDWGVVDYNGLKQNAFLSCLLLPFYGGVYNRILKIPLSIILNGKPSDRVTATLSLAAACSSAGIVVLYSKDLGFCKTESLPCGKYQLSVTFAFITWFFIAISSYLMFWILASI